MSFHEILAARRKQPFEPFRIHSSNGKVYDINHPELVMPGLTSAIVGIPTDPAHPNAYGRTQTLSLYHIVRLEPISKQSSSTGGNSSPRNGAH